MHNFRELKIWQKSRVLVKDIYNLSKDLPNDELFGLASQIKRSVVSIPSNIAEGCGRGTDRELSRFLDIANGSAFELETLLILASDLEYLKYEQVQEKIKELNDIEKMIYSFKEKLNPSNISNL